MLSSGMLDKR